MPATLRFQHHSQRGKRPEGEKLTRKVGTALAPDRASNSSVRNARVPLLDLGIHCLRAVRAEDAAVQVSNLVEEGRVGARQEAREGIDGEGGLRGVLDRVEGFGDAAGVVPSQAISIRSTWKEKGEGGKTYCLFSRQTTLRMVGYKLTTSCRPVTSAFPPPTSLWHEPSIEDAADWRVELLHSVVPQRVLR